MTMPYYVPPEQLVKDRADYARKGVARGKSIVAFEYVDGILLLGENPSGALFKVSEIYDRIAFAGAGRYNEFEALRVAGIRHADVKGYSYGRQDVAAKSLANAYSQTLGQIFTHEVKPYEIEILVGEVGATSEGNRLFRVTYDGILHDERQVCVIGGDSEELLVAVKEHHRPEMPLPESIAAVASAIEAQEERDIPTDGWEAAVIDRTLGRRTFRRIGDEEIAAARAG